MMNASTSEVAKHGRPQGDVAERHLVAVPDLNAAERIGMDGPRFRLGVQSNNEGATFSVGERGPNGQSLPWLYLHGEAVRYELDFRKGHLTVAVHEGSDDVRVVRYDIDVEAMVGQKVKVGEPVTIVFAYPSEQGALAEETAPVKEFLATTDPRYFEGLKTRLGKTSSAVVAMQQAKRGARRLGNIAHADRPPKSAHPYVVDLREDLETEEPVIDLEALETDETLEEEQTYDQSHQDAVEKLIIDLTGTGASTDKIEIERPRLDQSVTYDEPEVKDAPQALEEGPQPVLTADPKTGVHYKALRWTEPSEMSLEQLRDSGFRVVFLTLRDGESATIALRSQTTPIIQITEHHHVVEGPLTRDAWKDKISVGKGFSSNLVVGQSDFFFKDPPSRQLTSGPVEKIVATSEPIRSNELPPVEIDNAIADHRDAVDAAINWRRRRSMGISRNVA